MKGLALFLAKNKWMRIRIENCSCGNHGWEKMLDGRPENLIEATCCEKQICHGVSIKGKNPSFVSWTCAKGTCVECGVNKKLGVSDCDVWSECEAEMDVHEWVLAPRQGITNGKQNTQLELGQQRYQVQTVIKKFVDQLNACQHHTAEYKWKRHMMKRDIIEADPNKHRVICTDFGATLDLFASEKGELI
jgi:hypothetical protein